MKVGVRCNPLPYTKKQSEMEEKKTLRAVDILTLAEGICERLDRNGIRPSDVRYIQMWRDWQRIKAEGHKWDWIVYWLSNEHGLSETSVSRTLTRLGKEVEI